MEKEIKKEQEKVVNLFEDIGNHHDEDKLKKSYDRMDDKSKHE